ncbi:MAG: AMP-binding protein, partial [Bacillota bacterium]
MGEAVHSLLERNARKYPNEIAVRWPEGGTALTWTELNCGANALARHLRASGVKPGSRAAI